MLWQKIRDLFRGADKVEAVFRPEWRRMIEANVPLYGRLPRPLREQLHRRIARFVESTRFEGCNGLELTEEMVLTVAAQACLLVLGREGEPYPKLRNVYLYPSTFVTRQQSQDALGVVTEGEVVALGESWNTGTVILAWDSVAHGALNLYDGHNVTFHEFAHQLDHEDGPTDGAPPLPSREAYRSWSWVFRNNYADFHKQLEKGGMTVLYSYGATNPAEFFAVATEAFFEKPRQLARKRPLLYRELKGFYGVDPVEWFQGD